MKKLLFTALAMVLSLSLISCSSNNAATTTTTESATTVATTAEPAETIELVVFAAASMTETMKEIEKMYQTVKPNIKLVYNFDSSGTLKTQIQEGADCDIFISAGQKQVNELNITADSSVNVDGLDFVLQGTRVNLLENKVTLCVPKDNPDSIQNFADMAQKLKDSNILLAMGNSDVPVGQYTQKIFSYFELSEDELASAGKITYGSNVKEVTTQVSEGSVSCGVVYCTDAFSANLQIVDYATKEMCGQIIYPAALINTSKHQDEAKAFLAYLQTSDAMSVFENVGFASVK